MYICIKHSFNLTVSNFYCPFLNLLGFCISAIPKFEHYEPSPQGCDAARQAQLIHPTNPAPPHPSHLFAPGRGDVLLERDDVRDGFDRHEIHPHDQARHGHVLRCDLQPAPRCGAQIHEHTRLLQKLEFPVQLDQLERGASPVTSLLCKVVKLVLSPFPQLRLASHFPFEVDKVPRGGSRAADNVISTLISTSSSSSFGSRRPPWNTGDRKIRAVDCV